MRFRNLALSLDPENIVSQSIKLSALRWSGDVLLTENTHLPYHTLAYVSPTQWKKPRGGQYMALQCGLRKLTANLREVGVSGLRGWSPKDLPTSWLETLKGLAANYE